MRGDGLAFAVGLSISFLGIARGEESNQFRGPRGTGVHDDAAIPGEWSAETNVAWKAVVEGTGWSSPVVADGKVFVTSAFAEGQPKPKDMSAGTSDLSSMPLFGTKKPPKKAFQFRLTCLDLESGETLWTKTVVEKAPGIPIHPSNTFATESPATIGDRVFVYFGCVGALAAYDFDGQESWRREFETPPMSAGFGTGSSLATDGERLYLQRDNESASTLAALDPATGDALWSVERPGKSSWATPFVWRNSVRTEIVAAGTGGAIGYDPANGDELWRFDGLPSSASASPVGDGDLVFFGTSGPFSNSPLIALRAGASGDVSLDKSQTSSESVAWKKKGSGLGMASPLAIGGVVYLAESGIVRALDAETGEVLFEERLPEAKTFAASPFAIGETLHFVDEAGTTFVLKAGREFELLGQHATGETTWSTPCVAGDALILRSVDAIRCIRRAGPVTE